MKKLYLIIAITILTATFGCEMGAGKQSIVVVSNKSGYSFTAEYPKYKTDKVIGCLEEKIRQDKFFSNTERIKIEEIVLSNGSKFMLKSEPGYIKINFNKRDNAEENYNELIELCMDLKKELN